jgi:hypothetical protein
MQLNAQVKIREKISIDPQLLSTQDEPSTSPTINYQGLLYVDAQHFSPGDYLCSNDADVVWINTKIYCNGVEVLSLAVSDFGYIDYSPGTALTFTAACLADPPVCAKCGVQYPMNITEVYADDCGGHWVLNAPGFLYGIDLYAGRSTPLPPYYITFELPYGVTQGHLMYTIAHYIPIHIKDGCGYSYTTEPVVYRVEITQGKEWFNLFDEASGKEGKILDSLYSTDGWSGFYINANCEEPSEPKQGSVTVSSYGNVIPSATYNLEIVPYDRSLLVTPGRKEINYGDTTSITLTMIDQYGNPSGEELVNAQYYFNKFYFHEEEKTYSTLESLDSTIVGDVVEGAFPSIIFRTMDDIDAPDSLNVLIAVNAYAPCPDCDYGERSIVFNKALQNNVSDMVNIPNEMELQKLKMMAPTAFMKLQSYMRMKKDGNQQQMKHSFNKSDKYSSLNNATINSSINLNTSQYNGYTKSYYGLTKVVVRKSCIQVQNASLSVGDTTLLSFVYGSNGKPVPSDKLLDVSIIGGTGGEDGTLLVDGGTGTSFPGVTQPIRYIAPANISGESLVVPIVVSESEGTGSGPSANILQKGQPNLSLEKTITMSLRIQKILQAQGTLAVCPIGTMTMEKPDFPPCTDQTVFNGDPQSKADNSRCDQPGWAGTSWPNIPKSDFINFIACDRGNGCFGIQIQHVTINNYYSFCRSNVEQAGFTIVNRPLQNGLDKCAVIDDFTNQLNDLHNKVLTPLPIKQYVSEDAKIMHEKAHIENFNKILKEVIDKKKEAISRFCYPYNAGGKITEERIKATFKCDDIENELKTKFREKMKESQNNGSDEKYALGGEEIALKEIIKEIKKSGVKCPK